MEIGVFAKHPQKGFGFIARAGAADVFVSPDLIQKHQLTDGRVEFEFVPDLSRPGKFRATTAKMAAPAAEAAGPARAEPTVRVLPEIGINFEFEEPYEKRFNVSEGLEGNVIDVALYRPHRKPKTIKRLVLPVKVVVMRGTTPVLNQEVKLDVDGKPVATDNEIFTSQDGKASFPVLLDLDTTACVLHAIVNGKTYGCFWRKAGTQQASPSPPVVPLVTPTTKVRTTIEVEKSGPDNNGVYVFQIVALPDKEITIEGNVSVEARLVGNPTWSQNSFTADSNGRVCVEVKVKDNGAKGEICFRCESLVSKLRYVTSKN